MGERRGADRVLVGGPEGKRRLSAPRNRWKDNIKTDLKEVVWGDMDSIGVGQRRSRLRAVVSVVMNRHVP